MPGSAFFFCLPRFLKEPPSPRFRALDPFSVSGYSFQKNAILAGEISLFGLFRANPSRDTPLPGQRRFFIRAAFSFVFTAVARTRAKTQKHAAPKERLPVENTDHKDFFMTELTSIPISVQGYRKLEEELARLKSERPAIIQAIKEAREEGDLSENAGYDAARERQGMTEARINYIESRMARYQVVDLDTLSGDKVTFGATVEVEDVDSGERKSFTILGPDEADPARGSISFLSPVGQALLSRSEGDEVSVDIPRGRVTYEVTAVHFHGTRGMQQE